MIEDTELREQFATESEEHLDAIERLLGADATGRAAVDALFRAFHSLKGMAGAFVASGMHAVAHRCEDILGAAREGQVAVEGAVADALIQAVDAMRGQRAELLSSGVVRPAPEALLARLLSIGRGPGKPAGTPAPVEALAEADRHAATLAAVAEEVAAGLAPLADGPSGPASALARELAEYARAAGAPRLSALLLALEAAPGRAALPLFGNACRSLDALAAIAGRDAGTAALQAALAERVGEGELDGLMRALAARLRGAPDAGESAEIVAAAHKAGLIAAALGKPDAEALLLTIEDLWDRLDEPDAAAAAATQRTVLADRLEGAAHGNAVTSASVVAETVPPPLAVPDAFAGRIGEEAAGRLTAALAAGRRLYRMRLPSPATIARETVLLDWLGSQGAEILASRLAAEGDAMTLDLLILAGPDQAALEASRSAAGADTRMLPPLEPVGWPDAGAETTAAPSAATLRIRRDTIDGIIALEAEVRAAGLALAEAAQRPGVQGLPSALEALARDLPGVRVPEATALARRARDLLQEVRAVGNRLTVALRRLDEAMLELRVAPLEALFARMPRVARAVAHMAGKEVEVELAGSDVSIDRGLIELLADPLQHLVRNAVDHGVESPAQRLARGKPPRARLRVAAERAGADRVRITVADDGGGIDCEAVRATAVARGVLGADEAAALDDTGTHALLFRPGFSTRTEVSATSGRGVGLDVVEDAVHRAGGTITVESRAGQGTTFVMDLPLSAAMAQVLLLEAGAHTYAVPIARVETVLHGSGVGGEVELPTVVSLDQALGLSAPVIPGGIVVLRASGGRRIGLAVGRVGKQTDLLLRPLHPMLATLPAIGGVGVLGTGEPVVVLEPDGLLQA